MAVTHPALKRSSRLRRVYRLLADGDEHSTLEIVTQARVLAVNSAANDLRKRGIGVTCRRTKTREGHTIYLYRLADPPRPTLF